MSNRCFEMIVQLVETPVAQTIRFDFNDDDTMTIEMWADLTIVPLEPRKLTAYLVA